MHNSDRVVTAISADGRLITGVVGVMKGMFENFLDWVLAALVLVTLGLIAVKVISYKKARPRPLSFIDDGRGVAVGVDAPSAFAGFRFAELHPPTFRFEIHGNFSWTIWFTMAVHVPDRFFDLTLLPPVILCVPRGSTTFVPGELIGFNSRGQMTGPAGAKYFSAIERRAPTQKSLVYAIRPIVISTNRDGYSPMARYELRCHSTAPNTDSAGLLSTHFELAYQPRNSQLAGLVPGLGQLQPPPQYGASGIPLIRLQYQARSNRENQRDSVTLHPDELAPAPDARDGEVYRFTFRADQSYCVQGKATRHLMTLVNRTTPWLIGAMVAAFIGAVIQRYVN